MEAVTHIPETRVGQVEARSGIAVDGGLEFSTARATTVYGIYTAAVYLMSLPGCRLLPGRFNGAIQTVRRARARINRRVGRAGSCDSVHTQDGGAVIRRFKIGEPNIRKKVAQAVA